MFTEAFQELITLAYGGVKLEKLLTYRSLKEIAKWSRRIIRSDAGRDRMTATRPVLCEWMA